jgi:hypothetical protein
MREDGVKKTHGCSRNSEQEKRILITHQNVSSHYLREREMALSETVATFQRINCVNLNNVVWDLRLS